MSSKSEEVLNKIIETRGFATPWQTILANLDPEFVELLWRVTVRKGGLPKKIKELIYVALDASQKYETGLRNHIREALEAGATKEEVVEVIELVALVYGIPTLTTSTKILNEVLELKK